MKKSIGARTLPMPAPVWVIGTYDSEGKPNIMTAAWVGICCSKPPCVTVSLRKATYSYGNIVSRQAYTVNVPSIRQIRETDYAGIVSGRDFDKFERTGLSSVRSELVDAPYIAEFPVVMECRVVHTADLGLHTMFVGEIMDIKVDESLLGENDRPVIEKLNLFVYTGEYYAVGSPAGKAYTVGKDFE